MQSPLPKHGATKIALRTLHLPNRPSSQAPGRGFESRGGIRIVVSTPRCGRGNLGSNPRSHIELFVLRRLQLAGQALAPFCLRWRVWRRLRRLRVWRRLVGGRWLFWGSVVARAAVGLGGGSGALARRRPARRYRREGAGRGHAWRTLAAGRLREAACSACTPASVHPFNKDFRTKQSYSFGRTNVATACFSLPRCLFASLRKVFASLPSAAAASAFAASKSSSDPSTPVVRAF